MKERPILFSGPMVRAILDDQKTVTRLVVKGARRMGDGATMFTISSHGGWAANDAAVREEGTRILRCPYGAPGDRLWVRETFAVPPGSDSPRDVAYRADLSEAMLREERSVRRVAPRLASQHAWTPSIHMPHWASRLTLEVTDVRVERLQSITEEDARVEGVQRFSCGRPSYSHVGCCGYRTSFQALWDDINGEHAFAKNPWVWRVAFQRLP